MSKGKSSTERTPAGRRDANVASHKMMPQGSRRRNPGHRRLLWLVLGFPLELAFLYIPSSVAGSVRDNRRYVWIRRSTITDLDLVLSREICLHICPLVLCAPWLGATLSGEAAPLGGPERGRLTVNATLC